MSTPRQLTAVAAGITGVYQSASTWLTSVSPSVAPLMVALNLKVAKLPWAMARLNPSQVTMVPPPVTSQPEGRHEVGSAVISGGKVSITRTSVAEAGLP